MNICLIALLSLVLDQAQLVKIRIVDDKEKPIEGVYVHIKDWFAYSDTEGCIMLPEHIDSKDSISFSHLSFREEKMTVERLKKQPMVKMEVDVKEIEEVLIVGLDAREMLGNAIKQIPNNYRIAFEPSMYLHATISLKDVGTSSELVQYKGGLSLKREKDKTLKVAKNKIEEYILPDISNFIYTMKPHNFVTIIPVTSHPVIREFKKFDFHRYEYVSYRGAEAVKIYFVLDRKYGGQSGYVVVDLEDKAIMSVSYSIFPMDNWIGEQTKRGFVKTGLRKYFVEADYSKDAHGKYSFQSGRENIEIDINVKKKKISTSSDVYLKVVDIEKQDFSYTNVEHLFLSGF